MGGLASLGNAFDSAAGWALSPATAGQARFFGMLGNHGGGGGTSARDMNARLIRANYADWAARYKPIDMELAGMYQNPNLRQQALAGAQENFLQGFEPAQAAADDRLASLGVELTPGQKQARDRERGLSRSLGLVNAYNMTDRALTSRDEMLMTGAGGARSRWAGA